MSRIGRKPIEVPKGVQVSITTDSISVKGPKGNLNLARHKAVEIKQAKDEANNDILVFERESNLGDVRAAHGLMRALVNNMLTGVTKGFEKTLEINGVGYKAEIKGQKITLSLGYSHPIEYTLPEGVAAKTEKNLLILSSIDREKLGGAAAKIRGYRPPECYKGKGIKYSTETIVRKAGKTAGK